MNLTNTQSNRCQSFDFKNLAALQRDQAIGYNQSLIAIKPYRNFMLRIIILTLVFSASSYLVHAQCNHALKLERVEQGQGPDGGLIEVSVKTDDSFTSTLFSETGSGLKEITKQSGQGNKKITFNGLSSSVLYLVQVEFLNEKNKFCRKLQKSQITL